MKKYHKKIQSHLEKMKKHQDEAHKALQVLIKHETMEDKEIKKMRGRSTRKK